MVYKYSIEFPKNIYFIQRNLIRCLAYSSLLHMCGWEVSEQVNIYHLKEAQEKLIFSIPKLLDFPINDPFHALTFSRNCQKVSIETVSFDEDCSMNQYIVIYLTRLTDMSTVNVIEFLENEQKLNSSYQNNAVTLNTLL